MTIKHKFPNYLEDTFWLGPDEYFYFKYISKSVHLALRTVC